MTSELDQVNRAMRTTGIPFRNLQELAAIGLRVARKHDRAEFKYGNSYSAAQLAIEDSFTPKEIDDFRSKAAILIRESIGSQKQSWGEWGWSVVASVMATLLWTGLVLVIVYYIFPVFGNDFVSVAKSMHKKE